MNVESALQLVAQLMYKPGWRFEAEDHRNRFEGSIKVTIHYPARNSDKELAPAYAVEIDTYASFPVIVEDTDDLGLYRRIVDKLIEIETHEIREFLRVAPTCWAPFHPHRIDGMKRWGTVHSDLLFGVC